MIFDGIPGKTDLAKRKGKTVAGKRTGKSRSAKKVEKPNKTTDSHRKSAKTRKYVTNEKSNSAGKVARKHRSWRKRVLLFVAAVLLMLILTPVVLGFIYRSPAIHPVSTLMIADWVTGKKVNRRWVSFDKIAPKLVQAVMMSEDGRYCAHKGVDWEAINTIINDAMDGEKPRGASTITMQTVKNLFLWNSRSYIRKGLEVPLALYVDAIWSKRRQLEIYLNIAEWGPGIYGIDAASRHYFGRKAARLSRAQAALLAVTLPNPILRNPNKPSRRMKILARINRARARSSGAYVRCLKQG